MTSDTTAVADDDATRTPDYGPDSANKYLRIWLTLRPIKTSDDALDTDALHAALQRDYLGGEAEVAPSAGDIVTIDGKEYRWELLQSERDQIDLMVPGVNCDYAIAYAFATVTTDEDWSGLLGIGSDDGVKVFVNGEAVFETSTPRPIVDDQDLIDIRLPRGVNRILLKIQNVTAGWGFSCRWIDGKGIASLLGAAAMAGDLDRVDTLLTRGADPNAPSDVLAPPLQLARIFGHVDVARRLIDAGAEVQAAVDPVAIADAIMSQAYPSDKPGAAVKIVRKGEVLYDRQFGLANISDGIPVTADTKFRIASITKQFVACAILKLQEEGLLTVDDVVSKYVDGLAHGDLITLRHMLQHTSGLQNYTNIPALWKIWAAETSREDLMAAFAGDDLIFAPGTWAAYCNTGYYLLGMVVAKVSGKPWEEFVKERFIEPLGLTNTGIYSASDILKSEAVGYVDQGEKVAKAGTLHPSYCDAAGGLYSTVTDMCKWNAAVFGGKVISAESLTAAHTCATLADGRESNMPYGLGWAMRTFRDVTFIAHGGGIPGFLSDLTHIVEADADLAFTQNTTSAPIGKVTGQLAQIFLGDVMSSRATPEPGTETDQAHWPQLTGRYDAGERRVLHIDATGEDLLARFSYEPEPTRLIPVSATRYAWPKKPIEFEFAPDGSQIDALEHPIRKKFYRLPEPTAVDLDPVALADVTGEYGKAFAVKLSVEDGVLKATVPGSMPVDMVPVQPDVFVAREISLRIKVRRDGGERGLLVDFGGIGLPVVGWKETKKAEDAVS